MNSATKSETVRRHLALSVSVTESVMGRCVEDIVRAADLIATCFDLGGKLLICGNGGSAADAQHVAAEYVGRLRKGVERRALPALALTTDTSFLSAWANDYEWDSVFARQVEALGQTRDVLLAISTSGSSPNVLRASEAARVRGLPVIALTGDAGHLRSLADVAIVVPSTNTAAVQETMLAIEHSMCELVEDNLFGLAGAG